MTTQTRQARGTFLERKALQGLSRRHAFTAWLSLAGLLDAIYLTANHFAGTYFSCSGSSGCDEVLMSEFSTFGDVPLASLGILFYATVFGASVASTKRPGLDNPVRYATAFGLAVSAVLVWLQAVVIQAFCVYCMLSATVCLLLFVGNWLANGRQRRKQLLSDKQKV